jgi:hypothetical protein
MKTNHTNPRRYSNINVSPCSWYSKNAVSETLSAIMIALGRQVAQNKRNACKGIMCDAFFQVLGSLWLELVLKLIAKMKRYYFSDNPSTHDFLHQKNHTQLI